MAVERCANRALTNVTAGGTTAPAPLTQETWTVVSSAGFPAVSNTAVPVTKFHIADSAQPGELISVTNVSGTTWTVTRGAQGTTPVAHSASGFTVYLTLDGGFLDALGMTAAAAAPLPSGDTSGATDTAALQALENQLNTYGGGIMTLAPGTYWTTGLTKQSSVTWQGAGQNGTVIKLAAGANADVIQGAGFSTLTLGGTTGGINAWGIRDLTIDGNKASQSGTSYGIRAYGYNFELSGLIIRNCLTDGLYTEWAANAGGVTDGMEPRYRGLKIHNCGVNGWHDRGPHDARSWDVTIWANGTAGKGYWSESSNNTTVAAGSNGVDVSTFAGAGTLNVATTLNFPAASISATQGAISVTTALGAVTITYTGVTATSFTGCTAIGAAGGSTVSTGATVFYVGGFSAAGQLHTQMHVYANPLYDYVLDTQTHLLDCVGEVTQAGGAMVLIRTANCMLTGGLYAIYSGTTQLGAGIQLGDTANAASACRIDTALTGLAGSAAGSAALNIVNDGGFNSIDLLVNQASGQAVFGNAQQSTRMRVAVAGSGSAATDTANSSVRERGTFQRYVPAAAQQAWTITPAGGGDALNFRPPTNQLQHPNGLTDRWYSDNYSTATAVINGATGAASFASLALTAQAGPLAMNSQKVTGLANGAAATDAMALGQTTATSGGSPAGCIAQTIPLWFANGSGITAVSGTLYLHAVTLPAGVTVSNITWAIGSQGGLTLTHGWYVLVNSALLQVAHTADQTSGNLSSTPNTKALVTPYTPAVTAQYYLGYMIAAATQPTFCGTANTQGGSMFAQLPSNGPSSTAQTTPGTDGVTTYAAISGVGSPVYGYAS